MGVSVAEKERSRNHEISGTNSRKNFIDLIFQFFDFIDYFYRRILRLGRWFECPIYPKYLVFVFDVQVSAMVCRSNVVGNSNTPSQKLSIGFR